MNNQRKKKSKRKFKKKKNSNSEVGRKTGPLKSTFTGGNTYKMSMPRGLIAPQRFEVSLMYVDINHSAINSAGNKVAAYRYRPTSAYDVDPTIGGTTIAGFAEWSTIYSMYRVLAYEVEFFLANDEGFAITTFDIPFNADPGASPSLASVEAFLMNPYVRVRYLSCKTGNDRTVLRRKIDCKNFVGSTIQRYDDSYASAVTTSPVNNIFHLVGIWSGANNLINGVFFTARVSLRVEFFERNFLNN